MPCLCRNVQFALDPKSFQYYLIEVNPRVSRSSALASKASGYPIARVSAKIGVGMTLDEIPIANTPASFEPTLDYVVTKMPRFPFDKFTDANNSLSTQMKATGEVMSIGRTFEESLLKAIRSLEIGLIHLYSSKFDCKASDSIFEYNSVSHAVSDVCCTEKENCFLDGKVCRTENSFSDEKSICTTVSETDKCVETFKEKLLEYIKIGTDDRIYAIAQLLRWNCPIEKIAEVTSIDRFFMRKLKNIVDTETEIHLHLRDAKVLGKAKKMGFSDAEIAKLWNMSELDIFEIRKEAGIVPVYKMIDTCASEFESYIPYFYSTYEEENESVVSDKKKVIVLGSGPIRIGQGVEFDYSTVHAVKTIKAAGYEAIIINNNPETVSTDYTCSDKLYFEPLCVEDVMNVIELEQPEGVIATLGGQTAINLAEPFLNFL